MELVAIKSDLAFRAVFGREYDKCKQALTALLNDVLGLNIISLTYANPLNLQSYEEDKKSEMDIEVITNSGERIDIEIQLLWMDGLANRMVFYGGRLIGESLASGEDYIKMKKCKVLSIVDFTLFHQNHRLQNRFRFQEVEEHFDLSDVVEIIFLEMSKLDAAKPVAQMNGLERWLYFLKFVEDESKRTHIEQILQESEGITMAMEILQEVSANEELRTRIRFQEKAERDRIAQLNSARREGREEEKRAIAQNMLGFFDDKTISAMTGLPLEEVAALRVQQAVTKQA